MPRLNYPEAETETGFQASHLLLFLDCLLYMWCRSLHYFYILILSFNTIKVLRINNDGTHSHEQCRFYKSFSINLPVTIQSPVLPVLKNFWNLKAVEFHTFFFFFFGGWLTNGVISRPWPFYFYLFIFYLNLFILIEG